MPIIVNVDVMLAKRKMSSGELAEKVGITQANLSILKTGKAKAVRFSTLSDIPKAGKGKQVINTFDCEHISGFFRYPEEYTTAVVEFLTNN